MECLEIIDERLFIILNKTGDTQRATISPVLSVMPAVYCSQL